MPNNYMLQCSETKLPYYWWRHRKHKQNTKHKTKMRRAMPKRSRRQLLHIDHIFSLLIIRPALKVQLKFSETI